MHIARSASHRLLPWLLVVLAVSREAPAADLVDAIPAVMPAVVYLRIIPPARKPPPSASERSQEFDEFLRRFGSQGAEGGRAAGEGAMAGTGMIVSADGQVLTADFVVSAGASIEVELFDRRVFDAQVLGTDRSRGVALLKIAATGLPVVRFAQGRPPRLGEPVFAIGAPYRMPRTVSEGIVSRLDAEPGAFIQTTVAINPGSGGGPLANLRGEVIGMNHSIYSRTGAFQGIAFVVPASTLLRSYEELRATGRATRGSIGVAIEAVDGRGIGATPPTLPIGVRIREVEAGGGAEKAGMRAGDVVLRVDGVSIESTAQLAAIVRDARIGGSLRMDLLREGRVQGLAVEVGRAAER